MAGNEANPTSPDLADAVLEAVNENPLEQPSGEPGQGGNTAALQLALSSAQNDLARTKMELLKSQAEFENFRKRIRRDAEEEARYASVPLIRELLAVIDNLERAMQATDASASAVVDGVKLVMQQFNTALANCGCQRIEALGAEFDPHLHQALAQEPSDEHPAQHVSRVMQAGYKLHDRVIRPAQVFVSTGPRTA